MAPEALSLRPKAWPIIHMTPKPPFSLSAELQDPGPWAGKTNLRHGVCQRLLRRWWRWWTAAPGARHMIPLRARFAQEAHTMDHSIAPRPATTPWIFVAEGAAGSFGGDVVDIWTQRVAMPARVRSEVARLCRCWCWWHKNPAPACHECEVMITKLLVEADGKDEMKAKYDRLVRKILFEDPNWWIFTTFASVGAVGGRQIGNQVVYT